MCRSPASGPYRCQQQSSYCRPSTRRRSHPCPHWAEGRSRSSGEDRGVGGAAGPSPPPCWRSPDRRSRSMPSVAPNNWSALMASAHRSPLGAQHYRTGPTVSEPTPPPAASTTSVDPPAIACNLGRLMRLDRGSHQASHCERYFHSQRRARSRSWSCARISWPILLGTRALQGLTRPSASETSVAATNLSSRGIKAAANSAASSP